MNKKLVLSVFTILMILASVTFINLVSAQTSNDNQSDGSAPQVSTTIVISQVYGGGGGSTGTYLFDYIELVNISSVPQSLNGLYLQYGSATGQFGSSAGNIFALPNVTLQPGQHYLIQAGSTGSAGVAFPVAPDVITPNLTIAAASGKVVLTTSATGLECGATATPCAANDPRIIDLVAYGTANNAEGGVSVNNGVAITSTQGVVRKSNGCTDTDNNNNDFTVVTAPVPRNMSSPLTPCGGGGTTPRRVPMDFTGDGRTDWATIGVNAGAWRWKVTGNPASPVPNAAFQRAFDYGFTSDVLVPADYIGDRKTDPTVWRPGTPGIFLVGEFPIGPGGVLLDRAIQWGAATDRAIQGGDYDGDGKADYTVVRVAPGTRNLTWFIKSSATGVERAVPFGTLNGVTDDEAKFFPGADFNADGRDELVFVIANPTNGNIIYYVGDAITGVDIMTREFGNFDIDTSVAPGDYTGDGRADFVAVRQTLGNVAIWFIQDSATGAITATPFGIADPGFTNQDIPVRGDYDADGKFDIAVWRPSDQTFYYLRSLSNNTVSDGQQHGAPGDFPLAGLDVLF